MFASTSPDVGKRLHVGLEGDIRQPIPPPSDDAGVLEQLLHPGGENIVAVVDGVLDVSDQVGKADLVFARGPVHLAGVAIRDPVVRSPVAQKGPHHRLGPRLLGDEEGAVAVMEHPQPPVLLADPAAGFVGLDDLAFEEVRLDALGLVAEGGAAALRMLTIAPSLISSPNRSSNTSVSLPSGIAWTERR